MNHYMNVRSIAYLKNQLIKSVEHSNTDSLSQIQPKTTSSGRPIRLGLLFFNPSLRTRLSTQIAASELGIEATVIDTTSQGWPLEFETGSIMNAGTSEHIKEAVSVLDEYFDILAVRSFENAKDDAEIANSHSASRDKNGKTSIVQLIKNYSKRPFVNMESSKQHPLQGLADIITILENQKTAKPKIVLTWTPHVTNLPTAVPRSFTEFCKEFGYDLEVACPKGFEFSVSSDYQVTFNHDQNSALEGADFVYAKSWMPSATNLESKDPKFSNWTIDEQKMGLTKDAYFMHCLPIRRNVVATDNVLDSPKCLVTAQAKNRITAAKIVLSQISKGLNHV